MICSREIGHLHILNMSNIKSWIMAARPKTLSAALVPIIATVGLVISEKYSVNWAMVAYALFSSFFIQIGTNLVNDAMDFKKGADTEKRIGPQRVTQQGIFTFKQVMWAATVCFIISVFLGIPLVIQGGWPIVVIGLISVCMGYAYTSGPFPLAYRGLGDLFVLLFFGLVAVGGMYYILTGTYNLSALILGFQIGLLSTVLIAINNLRDIQSDVLVNKKTLAVRLGETKAKYWVCFLIVAPYLFGYYWVYKGQYFIYLWPTLALPLGISIIKKVLLTPPSEKYNQFLAQSSAYALLFSLLFLVGTQF